MSQWEIANNCFINRIVFILIFFVAYIFLHFIHCSLFVFHLQTFRHGFPHSPTALGYDPVQRLLAIGDKSGSLRMYPFYNATPIHFMHSLFCLFCLFGRCSVCGEKVFHFTIFTKCRRNITLHINENDMMTIAYIWLCEQLDKLTFRTYDDDDDDEKLRLFQKNQIEFHLATG